MELLYLIYIFIIVKRCAKSYVKACSFSRRECVADELRKKLLIVALYAQYSFMIVSDDGQRPHYPHNSVPNLFELLKGVVADNTRNSLTTCPQYMRCFQVLSASHAY